MEVEVDIAEAIYFRTFVSPQLDSERHVFCSNSCVFHYNSENILAVSASTWSVYLQLFQIDGEIPFDLFILTRVSHMGKSSALYYFQKTAEEAFFRAVLEFERVGL